MKRSTTVSVSSASMSDWTWLLRVPVAAGEPMPMELWFLYHANTILVTKSTTTVRCDRCAGEGHVCERDLIGRASHGWRVCPSCLGTGHVEVQPPPPPAPPPTEEPTR